MRKYLLPEGGKFYKANLHCHSTMSDGKLTPEELKKLYKENGYSVLAITDHDILIPHPELNDDEFLTLYGYEMEVDEGGKSDYRFVKTCHMCMIALDPDNLKQACYHRSAYLFKNAVNYRDQLQYDENEPDFVRHYDTECVSEMMRRGREAGFFVTYNHPTWSQEDYSQYMNYHNMHAMEIVNYSCQKVGYDEYNERVYDDMLRGGKRIYCIAADDNHNSSNDSCGGFVMIKADKLEYKTVTDALVKGNFYASEGPQITELYYDTDEKRIYFKCSDAQCVRLNTASRRTGTLYAKDGAPVTEGRFGINAEDEYVRLTVIDANGRHANTRAYFVDELLGEN